MVCDVLLLRCCVLCCIFVCVLLVCWSSSVDVDVV